MDPAEYLPLFVAECREHLQELNVAVLALEQRSDDAAGVDAIFRVVHSVKGMAGTMGFSGMARLTHEMEEVFELIRQRRGDVSRETIDIVLECLDELASAIDAVESGGEEQIDAEPLIPRLRALVRAPDALEPQGAGDSAVAADAPASGARVGALTVRVDFAANVEMPSVLAYLLLSALSEQSMLRSSAPAEDELAGWEGRTVEIVCSDDCELVDVEAVALAVEGVVGVTLVGEHSSEEPGAADDLELSPGSAITRTRTVRVDAERLDQLMHQMGELVVHRTQLATLVAQADVPGISQAMQQLERTTQALSAMVMKARMIEVAAVFARLPRLVRDTAGKLGKEVELLVSGAETELDRSVVDALGDPLVHLVRNAIDHGLESRERRLAAGKQPIGRLFVSARQAGGAVVIAVRDDGAGIDTASVAGRARERGLLAAAEELTDEQAREMLFRPGFSTAHVVGEISGRGVGLDAARDTVRSLGGDVLVHSQVGAGMVAEIRLPLTLAITSALLVEVAGLPFAVPLDRVDWTLALTDDNVRRAGGRTLLVLPDTVLPLYDAARLLTGRDAPKPPDHAVIVRVGGDSLALAVGDLIGQRELVTRPLPPELELSRPVSAAAMLAEGEIALIVDCDAVAEVVPKEVMAGAIAA